MSKVKVTLEFDSVMVNPAILTDVVQRFITSNALHNAESVIVTDDADQEREFVVKDRRGPVGWRARGLGGGALKEKLLRNCAFGKARTDDER